ncbi:MAG: hypothetical protein MN733_02850 [Nitrososphaera sp.]|nr:hypothetical protein [Nitrososphaera sp.]
MTMDEHTIKDKQGKRVATVRSGPDVWEQMRKEYKQHAQELKKCFKPGLSRFTSTWTKRLG